MWLESRSDAALAGGANLAALGEELIQFGRAEPLGDRRFRLSRLLRGRRGTEWAVSSHAPGEAFALLEPDRMLLLQPEAALANGEIRLAAQSIGDSEDFVPVVRGIEGRALQPPAPVHLQAKRLPGGDLMIRWTRRSRLGWTWSSGGDAPIGEEREAYRLTLSGAGVERSLVLGEPAYHYAAGEQAQGGLSGLLRIEVAQIGTLATSRSASLFVEL
jgi:hypothetical protein